MSPALLALIAQLIPALTSGVKDAMDIIERLQSGDEDAIKQAQGWLGVTKEVTDAITAWETSKTQE